MARGTVRVVALIVGLVMIGLALFLIARPFLPPGGPVTNARWLDLAFAAFFLLRGAMNVRSALRARAGELPR